MPVRCGKVVFMDTVIQFMSSLFDICMLPLSQSGIDNLIFSLPWLFCFFGLFFVLVKRFFWGLL